MRRLALYISLLALTTVSCEKDALEWDFAKSTPNGCTPAPGSFIAYKKNGADRLAISVSGNRYDLGLDGTYRTFYLDSTNDVIVKVHEFGKKVEPNFCEENTSLNSIANWSALEGMVQLRISNDSVAVNQDGSVQYVLDVKLQDMVFYKDGESGVIQEYDADEMLNVRMGGLEE